MICHYENSGGTQEENFFLYNDSRGKLHERPRETTGAEFTYIIRFSRQSGREAGLRE
jgi:hypothetical protein